MNLTEEQMTSMLDSIVAIAQRAKELEEHAPTFSITRYNITVWLTNKTREEFANCLGISPEEIEENITELDIDDVTWVLYLNADVPKHIFYLPERDNAYIEEAKDIQIAMRQFCRSTDWLISNIMTGGPLIHIFMNYSKKKLPEIIQALPVDARDEGEDIGLHTLSFNYKGLAMTLSIG